MTTSSTHTLKQIYNQNIQLDDQVNSVYSKILKTVLDTLISNMKQLEPAFEKLFSEIYYTGSFYDGLKVGATKQEFDLNIVFDIKRNIELIGLGTESRKPNFGFLRCTKQPSEVERNICFERDGQSYYSPKKMFNLVMKAGDRALTSLSNKVEHEEQLYRVTRSIGAPFTLKVSGSAENMSIQCEIDLVPSIKLNMSNLPRGSQVYRRVHSIKESFACNHNSFMAIALWRADSERFELDFHEIERGILYDRGCVKMVIRLIKHLRDIKGGAFFKLWSHLLKTVVMHQVIENQHDSRFWSERDLHKSFITCLSSLHEGLDKGSITDVFFPQFNMLTRIKEEKVIIDTNKWLSKILTEYKQSRDVLKIFNGCPICHKTSKDQHKHKNSKRMNTKEPFLLVENESDDEDGCPGTVDYTGEGLADHIKRYHPGTSPRKNMSGLEVGILAAAGIAALGFGLYKEYKKKKQTKRVSSESDDDSYALDDGGIYDE